MIVLISIDLVTRVKLYIIFRKNKRRKPFDSYFTIIYCSLIFFTIQQHYHISYHSDYNQLICFLYVHTHLWVCVGVWGVCVCVWGVCVCVGVCGGVGVCVWVGGGVCVFICLFLILGN